MKDLKKDVNDFTKNVSPELKQKLKRNAETKFASVFQTNIDINMLRLYVLKHNCSTSLVDYERVWTSLYNNKPKMNESIPCSYFMLDIKNLGIESQDKEVISIRIRKIRLMNIKLADNPKTEEFN